MSALLNQQDRDKLIQKHLDYTKALTVKLHRQLSSDLDFEELYAAGTKGLVEAAQRFDPSRGVAFTTFSYYRIRGAIFDGLRQSGWLSRSEYGRFTAAANDYMGNRGDRVQPDAPLSRGDTVGQLNEALGELATIFVTSLSAADLEDPPDTAHKDPGQTAEDHEINNKVKQAVTRLPEKEQRLVQFYYFEGLSMKDAGAKLGLSKSWTSRLHARAVKLLSVELEESAGL